MSRDGKRIKYEANCGKRYIGGYETVEEAREAYEAFVKGERGEGVGGTQGEGDNTG